MTTDLREIRRHIESGGLFRDFPLEDCHCMICGSGGCLLYPGPSERTSRHPDVHGRRDLRSGGGEPSLVCPSCSTRNAEAFLRYMAGLNGYELRPVGVFTTETTYQPEASS